MAERKIQHPSNIRQVAPATSPGDDDGEEDTGGDALFRADSGGSSTSSSGVILLTTSSRRERHSLRRVQPLGEDESEEARAQGAPVPTVGLLPEQGSEVGAKVGTPAACAKRLFRSVDPGRNASLHLCMNACAFHVLRGSTPTTVAPIWQS